MEVKELGEFGIFQFPDAGGGVHHYVKVGGCIYYVDGKVVVLE